MAIGSAIEPVFLLFLCLIGFACSYMAVALMRTWALRAKVMDVPTTRSSHEIPTPRGGGMGLVFAFFCCMFVVIWQLQVNDSVFWAFLISALGIAILGFTDDLLNLPRRYRFAAWILIAILSMALGIRLTYIVLPGIGRVDFGLLSFPLTFVWLIGVTNFYNFMDGIDGLAGGEAVIVGSFLGLIGFASHNELVGTVALVLAICALGFLMHNFPPARIFMGDGGSNFLGFAFAALGIIGAEYGSPPIPFVIPVLLLGMFLYDATIVLLKHIPRGKNWLEPHRDHYYQRLILLGYTHLQVTLLYWTGSILLGLLALAYLAASDWTAGFPLLAACLIVLGVISGVNYLERRQRSSHRIASK